jgi:hypothetical protein
MKNNDDKLKKSAPAATPGRRKEWMLFRVGPVLKIANWTLRLIAITPFGFPTESRLELRAIQALA